MKIGVGGLHQLEPGKEPKNRHQLRAEEEKNRAKERLEDRGVSPRENSDLGIHGDHLAFLKGRGSAVFSVLLKRRADLLGTIEQVHGGSRRRDSADACYLRAL